MTWRTSPNHYLKLSCHVSDNPVTPDESRGREGSSVPPQVRQALLSNHSYQFLSRHDSAITLNGGSNHPWRRGERARRLGKEVFTSELH